MRPLSKQRCGTRIPEGVCRSCPGRNSLLTRLLSRFVVAEANKAVKPAAELKKAAASTFAAIAIGSSILGNPLVADAMDVQPMFSSTNVVAEKVVRQGLYNEYEVEISQEKDDARSTFKSAGEFQNRGSRCFGTIVVLEVFVSRCNSLFFCFPFRRDKV